MTNQSRWTWLLLPPSFGITYRLAIFLYWLPERHAWITTHGGDAAAAAFGEGEHDATATLAMAGPLVIALFCYALVRPPRSLEVAGIGVAAAVWAFGLQIVFASWLAYHLGGAVALHGPVILATGALVFMARRTMQRQIPRTDAAA